MTTPTRSDAALGAVLGALVGDAAGAVLEFLERPVTPEDVAHALSMPGGGCWRVAPGQITDDGELTMSLLGALAAAPAAPRPREAAAKAYARWVASRPFDIGGTTAKSLGCLRHPRWGARAVEGPIADLMTEAAAELCSQSKANGSLMRTAPLGLWAAARRKDDAAAAAAAADDARLSHPNRACVDAAGAYVIAIASLVRAPGDGAAALDAAARWAEAHACDEVRAWMADARTGIAPPCAPLDGFVRIAFTHAFLHLARGSPYEEALRETLAGGGDTDTNACIVGGLVGARWGAGAIPPAMREAVLGCDLTRGAHPCRPDALHPRHAPRLVEAVLASRIGQ
jgi:ADP-ribosylglycohydrolase